MKRNKTRKFGVCDIETIENGKKKKSYITWCHMLERCFSLKYQKRKPTYQGCTVSPDWLTYSNFDDWFNKNYISGFDLDKDLLVYGNKEYGPNTCRFVPRQINNIFLDRQNSRGKYLIGVCWHKQSNKFSSQCNMNGKGKHLGYFDSELEAHNTWKTYKLSVIKKVCDEALQLGQIHKDLYEAIINRPI